MINEAEKDIKPERGKNSDLRFMKIIYSQKALRDIELIN
jgi:hypothetical protein